jgi:ribosomal protein S18 acetylase RimI-like enzyme
VAAGLRDGLRATAAIAGTTVVGAAVSHGEPGSGRADLLALGVAPGWRRRGLAGAILTAHADAVTTDTDLSAVITVAERDPIDPLDGGLRRDIARRIFTAAGFEIVPATVPVRAADPAALGAIMRRTGGIT